MKRHGVLSGGWTWDQLILILGPVVLSLVLVIFYFAGALPVSWPALLIVVAVVNLAGDVVFALKSERDVRRGRVSLRNDIVDRRAVAEADFSGADRGWEGPVTLAGERWRAVCDQPVRVGAALRVVGRRGLVLDVVPDEN